MKTIDITEHQRRKIDSVVAEMTGPVCSGNDVLIEGHSVPNLVMHDHGDMVEFVLDGRFSFSFPREWAYLAASFAASAMAIGAGHPSIKSAHRSHLPYARPSMLIKLDDTPV